MKRIFVDLEMNPIGQRHKELRGFYKFEVIEFGAVCLDEDYREICEYQRYVRPEYNSEVVQHITQITGIKTKQVVGAEKFEAVLKDFISWCGDNYRIYSWSGSDLIQLQNEMRMKGIAGTDRTDYMFRQWTDLQDRYDQMMFCDRQIALKAAIASAGIDFKGRAHGALTDARAAADLFREMKRERSRLNSVRKTLADAKKPLGTNLGELIGARFAFA